MTEEKNSEPKAKQHALAVRKRLKSKKPDFRRQEGWRYKRLKESWRRPRGIDSKMRMKVKGWPKSVEIGYRGPKEARGLHPSGYAEVLVHNVDKVDKVDPKTQVIRIAHTVGARKQAEISARASKRGILIINPKGEGKAEEAATSLEEKEEGEQKVES
jgi:large subunit ribosomal protein L32e